jgi:gephyrin
MADGAVATNALLPLPQIGLLAGSGCASVEVYSRPRVVVMSTGDEVVAHDSQSTRYGQVRDRWSGVGVMIESILSFGCFPFPDTTRSNRPMLISALWEQGIVATDLGIVPDDPDQLKAKLRSCLQPSDVVITSGGVSMGEKDLLKEVLLELGATIHFGRVHMKPGKPTTFATVPKPDGGGLLSFFALPGERGVYWEMGSGLD